MANGTCFEARYDASDVLVSDGAPFKGKSAP